MRPVHRDFAHALMASQLVDGRIGSQGVSRGRRYPYAGFLLSYKIKYKNSGVIDFLTWTAVEFVSLCISWIIREF